MGVEHTHADELPRAVELAVAALGKAVRLPPRALKVSRVSAGWVTATVGTKRLRLPLSAPYRLAAMVWGATWPVPSNRWDPLRKALALEGPCQHRWTVVLQLLIDAGQLEPARLLWLHLFDSDLEAGDPAWVRALFPRPPRLLRSPPPGGSSANFCEKMLQHTLRVDPPNQLLAAMMVIDALDHAEFDFAYAIKHDQRGARQRALRFNALARKAYDRLSISKEWAVRDAADRLRRALTRIGRF